MGEFEGSQPADGSPRRRRVRTRERDDAPPPPPPTKPAGKAERDAERGLRGLVGSGPSQVGISGAMRARDASQPTDEELAAAERDVVIVRRHYVPTEAPSYEPPSTC